MAVPYVDDSAPEDRQPRVVHVLFKTHLDIGFTNLARAVVEQYMTRYIPAAIELARLLRARRSGSLCVDDWLLAHL